MDWEIQYDQKVEWGLPGAGEKGEMGNYYLMGTDIRYLQLDVFLASQIQDPIVAVVNGIIS